MTNSLIFGGEKIASRSVQDLCDYDITKCYMLAFCGCRRELKEVSQAIINCEDVVNCIETALQLDLRNVNVFLAPGAYTETDPVFSARLLATPPLYSFTETDPIFSASDAASITATDIINLSNLSGVNTGDDITIESTGLISGGILSINGADTSKFDLSAGTGIVVDNHTDQVNPTKVNVSRGALSAQTPAFILTYGTTYIGIDSTGTLQYRNEDFTPTERRDIIPIGRVDHPNNIDILFAQSEPSYNVEIQLQMNDGFSSLGSYNMNGGNLYLPVSGLNIQKTDGHVFDNNANYAHDKTNPHIIDCPANNPCDINYFYRTVSGWNNNEPTVTTIDPNHYDDGTGTLADVPVGKRTIQIISLYPVFGYSGNDIQYGQVVYDTLEKAKYHMFDAVVLNPYNTPDLYRTYLVVQQGATDLTDPTQAHFVNSGKRGLFASGDLAIPQVSTLDGLLDVTITSPAPLQYLVYNGIEWINDILILPTSAGAGVNFFYTSMLDPISGYDVLQLFPDATPEVIEVGLVNNNEVLIDPYVSSPLSTYIIDSGIWKFNTYCSLDSLSGVSTLVYRVYLRTALGVETLLFSAETRQIISMVPSLMDTPSAQPSFACNPTDSLVVKVYAKTTSLTDVNVSFYHSGSVNYSYVVSPFVISHNQTKDIQGGNTTQRYHMTLAEYTIVGNTSGVNTGDETSTTIKTKLGIASAILDGYLTASDWLIFNSKQDALGFTPYNATNPANYISLLDLSSSATGITYTNTSGIFSLTSGYVIPTTSEESNWNTAYSNRITSLTTTGNSGAATLLSNVLNIPNYTLSGLGGVPTSTTVNGHALSANVTVSAFDVGLGNVVNLDTSTTANIGDFLNKRFVTDADLIILSNTSGVNTGDNAINSLYSGLATQKVNGYGNGIVSHFAIWTDVNTLNNYAFGTANQIIGMNTTASAYEYKSFAVGSTGTDFTITNTAGIITFNIPDASATARGLINTSTQTIGGLKSFTDTILLRAGTATTGTSPLKFTSGTLMTVPEVGSLEMNTDDLYFTITTGAARQKLARILTGSASLDFPNTAGGASSDLTIAVTGAALGDSCSIGTPVTWTANTIFTAFVSAANTVTVRFSNFTGGNVNPAIGTYKVNVFKN